MYPDPTFGVPDRTWIARGVAAPDRSVSSSALPREGGASFYRGSLYKEGPDRKSLDMVSLYIHTVDYERSVHPKRPDLSHIRSSS